MAFNKAGLDAAGGVASGSAGKNNILWGNTGYQVYDFNGLGEFNCIQDYPTTAGAGLINADPRFVDPSQDVLDFHLRPDSPCIDAGTSLASLASIPDPDGDLRPYRAFPPHVHCGDGTGYDIGADEFIGHPAPPLLPDATKALILGWPLDAIPPASI